MVLENPIISGSIFDQNVPEMMIFVKRSFKKILRNTRYIVVNSKKKKLFLKIQKMLFKNSQKKKKIKKLDFLQFFVSR